MSLINDALKRARETQRNDPPSGAAPLSPVESASRGGAGWILTAAAILFLGAVGFCFGPVLFGHKASTVVMAHTAAVAAPPAAVTAPAPAPPVTKTNPPAVTPASPTPDVKTNPPLIAIAVDRSPKVQGIIFNSAQPLAIVDGHTVAVGDRVGDFQVKQITQTRVLFQRPDGSQKTLEIGK